ncbi:neurofilament heavy polypeptide-like [Branchiostoma lanceolatum]|uniref:neurofilament heavy polypeptide-like n=1 Tax=Branchiostoma lanceolatum TaxID=7740 RepID=UPI003451B898
MATDREVSVRIPKRAFVLLETAVLVDTAYIAGVPVSIEIVYKGEPAVQYRSIGNGKIQQFSFTPKRLGAHFVNVLVNGYSLGEPALIDVRSPYFPDAARVRVCGPGLKNGDLDTYRGNIVCETVDAGTGVLMVNVLGPAGTLPVMTTALDGPNCPVAVSFQPPSAGDYYIHIKWTDDHVPGSPFKVELAERRKPGLMSKLFSKSSPNQDAQAPVVGFPPKEGEGEERPPEGPSYEEIDHWVNTGLWSPSSSDSSSSGKENKPISPAIQAEQKAEVSANLKRHQSFITRKYRAIVKRESKRERQAPLKATTEGPESDDMAPSGLNEPSHVVEEVKCQADPNMASKMATEKKENTKPQFVAGVLRKSLRGNKSSYDLNHDGSKVKLDRRMTTSGMISDPNDGKLDNRLSQSQPDLTPNRNTQGFVFLGKKAEEEIVQSSSPQIDTKEDDVQSVPKKLQKVSFVENEEVAKDPPNEDETTKVQAQVKGVETSTPTDSHVEKPSEEKKHEQNEKRKVKEKTTLCFPKKRKPKKNKSSPVIRKTDKPPTLSSMKSLSKSVERIPSDIGNGTARVSLVRVESIKW